MTSTPQTPTRALPPLFISHGSPMTALEPGEAGAFMQRLGPAIDAQFGRPKAVLMLSAHTLARQPVLLAAAQHDTVYDFGDFDARLNTLRYDAPGAPALALRVQALLQGAGWPTQVVNEGGLDHGIWTPMRYLWPQADVPVLPLAWSPYATPAQLFAMGQALAPLCEDGVLVVGTGNITHNLRHAFAHGRQTRLDLPEDADCAEFRQWFAQAAQAGDGAALLAYRQRAPHAVAMHPSEEHLLPFFIAAGAAGGADQTFPTGLRLHDSVVQACIGMDSYAFGPGAKALMQAA